jgi:hypothetical protein
VWRRLGERAGVAALCAGSGNALTSAVARAVGLVPVDQEAEEAEEEDEGAAGRRPALDGGFDTSRVPAWAQEAATALLRGVRAARELERAGLVVV